MIKSIIGIFFGVFFCLAMEGASESGPTLDPTDIAEDSRKLIVVKIYNAAKGKQIAYYGYWDINDLHINGVLAEEKILVAAHTVYSNPGKSDFLEWLMGEMRRSRCVGDTFIAQDKIAPALSDGILDVKQGLTWATTYLYHPPWVHFCTPPEFLHNYTILLNERDEEVDDAAKAVNEKVYTLAVQICLPDITISGFLP